MTRKEQELLAKINELEQKLNLLQGTVDTMQVKQDNLTKKVSTLQDHIEKIESINAVATNTSYRLQRELETQQQYSRRSCLVLDGINLTDNETEQTLEVKVKETVEKLVPGAAKDLDKTHRIGPVREGKQSTIVRFSKHSTVKKIYDRRKTSNGIKVRPSLTNFRRKELKKAQDLIQRSQDKSFVFADIFGTLKVRFEKQLNGRYVYEFYNIDELRQLIIDQDYSDFEESNTYLS